MRRLTTRPDRAPVTGPAAWFIRFVGVDGVIGPLGFGGFTMGGKERTETEWRELLTAAGFAGIGIRQTGTPFSIVQATAQ